MMTKNSNKSETQLDKLKSQQVKLAARIQQIEARSKVSERKQETRRKILVGAYYLDQARKNDKMEEIKNNLRDYLTRKSDRQLFDLPEIIPLEGITKIPPINLLCLPENSRKVESTYAQLGVNNFSATNIF